MKFYSHITLIYIASALSVAVLVIFGLLYMEKSREQVQYIDAVEHTYKVLSAIDLCEKDLLSIEASQRGYLLTREIHFKEAFEYAFPSIDSSLQMIGQLTSDNPGQKVFIFQLKKYVLARVNALKENLALKTTDLLFIENVKNGVRLMDYSRFYMEKMRATEKALLKKRLDTKDKYQRLNLSFFKATFIISCLICVIAIAFFFRELTTRVRIQKNLKAKIKELSSSKHELEEITSAASHDLQEPMRKIRILSNLAAKRIAGKLPEEELEDIYRINKIAEQTYGQLNDLVLYTTLLNLNERHTEVKMYELVKQAYEKVFKNEQVQFRAPANLPVIYGHKSQLETMLVQLLDNASKFKAPDRELIVTVNYELRELTRSDYFWKDLSSQHYHRVSITDNGIGFDKQYNEKIFGLFQRLHTTTEYPGRGIGLSLARRVMSHHKGYISASGEKNAGATFILCFPVV